MIEAVPDVAVVTKLGLAATVEFDWDTAANNINAVRPGMQIFGVSSKTGTGMSSYLEFLESGAVESRAGALSAGRG